MTAHQVQLLSLILDYMDDIRKISDKDEIIDITQKVYFCVDRINKEESSNNESRS